MAPTGSGLYARVVSITDVYLGPAAERFISRQVQNHLHKEPSEFSESDLVKLIDWVRVAFSLLTEDAAVVEEYIGRLQELTSPITTKSIPKHRAPKAV